MSIDPNAENYVNDAGVEAAWAAQAMAHAEVYHKLLASVVDPAKLTLTALDDDIYRHFREDFPDLDVAVVDYEAQKTAEGKEKWRTFCNKYEGRVQNFNMGTLIRVSAAEEIGPNNSFLGVRMQFLAIEIARNREGHNQEINAKAKAANDNKS